MHFKDYANYYNLLYKDKNYKAEVDYINLLVKKYNPRANTLIDLGCGTGNHVFEFESLGYDVTGVDLSSQMISIAAKVKEEKKSKAVFYEGDIRNYQDKKKYDAIVSLFHVMSYQTSNNDLESAFGTAKDLMAENGVFIFDCWYGPGVLCDLPSSRTKNFEDDVFCVERISHASIDFNSNIVEVVFDVTIENKSIKVKTALKEVHPMRYIFKTEVEFIASKFQMEIIAHHNWMTTGTPTEKSWYSVFVLGNKQ